MKKRLDALADMGTSIITISGGEPLMHPDLDEVIRHMRRRGMIAGVITNGFYLKKESIERLNEAGGWQLAERNCKWGPGEGFEKRLREAGVRWGVAAAIACF